MARIFLWVLALAVVTSGTAGAADLRRIDVTDAADMAIAGCGTTAVPDDGGDDHPAFACALGYLTGNGNCAEAHAGVLHVPSGVFDFKDGLVLSCGVQVVGNGYATVLNQLDSSVWLSKSFITMGDKTILRDLKLDQFQPEEPEAFRQNSFTVQCQGGDILVENVMLFKAYRGIAVGGLGFGVGRVLLRNIRGQPLSVGILMDNILDVVRIEDVHFWPFWTDSLGESGRKILAWVQERGFAIRTARNDNPFISRVFLYGYHVGLDFFVSSWPDADVSGFTSKAKVSQMDCDFCSIGVWMSGDGARDNHVVSFSYLPGGKSPLRVPLLVSGKQNRISMNDVNVDQLPTNAVRVTGDDNFVRVGQWFVRRWNLDQSSSEAFADWGSSNKVWVRDSYSRWNNGNGVKCSPSIQSCEVEVLQNL